MPLKLVVKLMHSHHKQLALLQNRYNIDDSKQPPRIRANQGHSFDTKDLELQPVTDASQVPFAVHVTAKSG